jgi:hypothetical protein
MNFTKAIGSIIIQPVISGTGFGAQGSNVGFHNETVVLFADNKMTIYIANYRIEFRVVTRCHLVY